MMIVISKNKIMLITPLLTLTFLAVFSFVLKDFNLPIIASYAVFIVLALFYIGLNRGKIYINKTQMAAMMFAIVATIMVFLPYARTDVSTVSVIMSLDIAMLYIIICCPIENDVIRTMKILLLAAVIMSVYAIAVSIYPNLYYGIVKHLIPADTQATIELGFKYHYGVAVGGESIVIDYYAFFGLIISLNALLLLRSKLKDVKFYVIILVICVLAIIVQNRKAEVVATLVVVCFLFFSNVNVITLKQKRKQLLIFLIVAVICIVAFLCLFKGGYLSRYETFFEKLTLKSSNSNAVDISSGRMILWKRAYLLFQEHPIFGIGWGNFRNHISDTFNVFNNGQLSNVHNNYLQILCENGIVGFIFFVTPLFYILYRTFRTTKYLRINMPENYTARIAVSTSLSFQLFYLVISFIDPVWYKMFTWSFYGIAVILMIYAERCKELIK